MGDIVVCIARIVATVFVLFIVTHILVNTI